MLNSIKKYPILFALGLIFIALGVILLFVDASSIMNFISVVAGIATIFTGLAILMIPGRGYFTTIYGLLYLFAGVSLMFFHHFVVNIVLSVLLLVFPIYRIITSDDKLWQLKREIPVFIILLLVLLVGFDQIVKYGLAGAVILFGLYLLFLTFSKDKKERPRIKKDESIDVNFTEHLK